MCFHTDQRTPFNQRLFGKFAALHALAQNVVLGRRVSELVDRLSRERTTTYNGRRLIKCLVNRDMPKFFIDWLVNDFLKKLKKAEIG